MLPSFTRLQQWQPRRVLVLRALVVGDMLCSVPALRALRAALPDAQLTLCGLPWAQTFVDRYSHYLDDFVAFPGYPGLPEKTWVPEEITSFLHSMQANRYDLAIQLQGSGSYVNSLIALFGAKRSTGFFRVGDYCEYPDDYLPYPEEGHEMDRLLTLCEFLGAPREGTHLEFPLSDNDTRDLAALQSHFHWDSAHAICVHAGARFSSRRWLPERFAAVADQLAEQGYSILLTGTEAERPIAERIASQMKRPPHILAGRTSLGAVAALVQSARLVLTNDTGMSHLATAVHTPSVVLAMGSDPSRWAPLDNHRHRCLAAPIACRPCNYETCPIGFPCATALEVSKVVDACLTQLARYIPPPQDASVRYDTATSLSASLAAKPATASHPQSPVSHHLQD